MEVLKVWGCSVNTVKGYVSNIPSEIHLADRTLAAVYAWQQGIVRC